MQPILHFDFVDHEGNKQPVLFENAKDIIIAETPDEVIPALKKVQQAVIEGYYAAGYLSYEAAPAFNPAFQVHKNQRMPLLWFGIFKEAVPGTMESDKKFHTTDWTLQTEMDEYCRHVNSIKRAIEMGDTQQVNYTTRMLSKFSGDPIAYFEELVKKQAANYSAYLDIGNYSILSVSPELFFHLKDGKLTTKPMKGTIGRGKTANEDKENALWLYQSEKNRAENRMIVDVLRNEFNVIAKPGTVEIPKLFSIESYPTVYQMTSTVTADMPDDIDIAAIFRTLFPCGSITGAPKLNTMNIIQQLEDSPREVYCGAIGFITPEQEAIFNVPIRTVIIDHNTKIAQYGVGGGITWNSDDQEEYEEVLTKAKVLQVESSDFQLLETIGYQAGEYVVLKEHMERLEKSADYFRFAINIEEIEKTLRDYKKKLSTGNWKIRLLAAKDGGITIEAQEITQDDTAVRTALARAPIDRNDIFLYHKTTNRAVYQEKLEGHEGIFDVLLWNENEELTEFTTGNLVVEINGVFYTPPVSCGLLKGTFRSSLLEKGIIRERIIKVEELPVCDHIWFINSVRKWVPVEII